MLSPRSAAIQFIRENKENTLGALKEWVCIPSISTDPEHSSDMARAAEWIAARIAEVGIKHIEIYPTALHPIVFGEYSSGRIGAPTVLIYGHYDVQPAEPLELWNSDPFDPVIHGENLIGRGASDMKGQVLAATKAVEAILKQGDYPINIKFLIEGEEEIGSPSLAGFMESHQELLACDVALNADTGMIAADVPTITYGLRGLAYFELRVYGPAQDLHSGLFGGVVHNPAQAICELVAGMHDEYGRVTLPGFYDNVLQLSEEERIHLGRLPVTEQTYLTQTGVPQLWGEAEYSPVERVGVRPTLEVNGLYSGFTGEGSKTVIPAWAMAKISMRLVPDQNPYEVEEQLKKYLEEHCPATICWELKSFSHGHASISDIHTPYVTSIQKALEQVWGKEPVFRREGGSVPVVADMQRILGIESVLTGFGLPDDNIHGPNEKLHLPTWYKGTEALVHFFYNLTEELHNT